MRVDEISRVVDLRRQRRQLEQHFLEVVLEAFEVELQLFGASNPAFWEEI